MRRETALFVLEFSARILRRKKLAGLFMVKVNMVEAVHAHYVKPKAE